MTLSGLKYFVMKNVLFVVLIPLLVDDPLWDFPEIIKKYILKVLIPLLVDDPLWDNVLHFMATITDSLNPSFSG